MYRSKMLKIVGMTVGTITLLATLGSRSVISQTFDLVSFQNMALSEHNTYRATHHAPSLTLNNSLSNTAQAYAESMLQTGEFAHSSNSQRNGAGENLFYAVSTNQLDAETIAKQTVAAWYEEVANYNYSNPGFSLDTGHFTQVVWKGTTQLGCGVAQGPTEIAGRNATVAYVVCHYSPPGNVQGNYPANVLQP